MLFKSICFLFAIFGNSVLTHDKAHKNNSEKPDIFIIGTIHNMHFDDSFHYSINDLQAQIIALKPDLVCGEIAPDALGQITEGYYPPEAIFLAEMAEKLNYRFEAVDWRLDYYTQSKAESIYPKDVNDKVDSFGKNYFNRMNKTARVSIYDEIHNESNIALVDSVFENIIGKNPISEIAHGSWQERNRRIVENGLAAIKNSKRVVFVIGSDHIPQIRRQLNYLGYVVKIPERLFVPRNRNAVPDEVFERWNKNLTNLKLITEGKIHSSYDYFLKIKNSHRIRDLEIAIEKTSFINSPANGYDLIKQMYLKHNNKWYNTLSFSQEVINYQNDTISTVDIMHEAYKSPGNLILKYDDFESATGYLFVNDSVYNFNKGVLQTVKYRIHDLLVLGIDVNNIDPQISTLRAQKCGYDLNLIGEDVCMNKRAWVVGDTLSTCFWVDMESLLFLKMRRTIGENSRAVEFAVYEEIDEYPVATKINFYNNDGNLYMVEKYFNIKPNSCLTNDIFLPKNFKSSKW